MSRVAADIKPLAGGEATVLAARQRRTRPRTARVDGPAACSRRWEARDLRRIIVLLLLLMALGAGGYLAFLAPPPPARSVEIVVPDERLPR